MTIGDLCTFKVNFPDADFWLIRKGGENVVGKPTNEFSEEHIGVKVTDTSVIVPQYLFYVFLHLQTSRHFTNFAKGSLRLKHISVADIKNIPIGN